MLLAARVILPEAAVALSSSIDPVPEPVIPKVAVPVGLMLKLELVMVRALAPIPHVEAADPLRLRAPAESRVNVPEVVVETVRLPPALVMVRPAAPGPVTERADPLAKVRLALMAVVPRLLSWVLA